MPYLHMKIQNLGAGMYKSSWWVRTRGLMPTACAHDFLFFCLLSIVLDSVSIGFIFSKGNRWVSDVLQTGVMRS